MQLLLEHPEQRARLVADPSLIGNAIDEMVRFSPPVPPFSTREVAKEDVVIGGQLIRRGQSVVVVLGAANRDPEVFADPDRFDVGRSGLHRHVGFGIAPHACLARAFVQMEGEVFFPTVLELLPDLRPLDAEPDWIPFRPFGRELRTLRVSVT